MPYLNIKDFKYGMDRRRPQTVGVPGTLWQLKNAVVSRGGDVLRMKKFVLSDTPLTGTFGLYALKGQRWVFGSGSTPGGLPAAVQYQQLVAPSTPTMTGVLDVKASDGKLYVIAEYDDGHVYHFYDGSRVTDWDSLQTATASDVARRLARKLDLLDDVRAEAVGPDVIITAETAGTAFTITGSAVNGGGDATEDLTVSEIVANVAAVSEVRATGSVEITGGTAAPGVNKISQVTVNGVNLLESAVNWATSHAATALALSNAINNYADVSGYTASVADEIVTIRAMAGTGATPNGYVVNAVAAGNVTTADTAMAGGVAAVTAVAQVSKAAITGTIENADTFSVTVNGTEVKATGLSAVMGTSVFMHKQRAWSPVGSLVRYSKLTDASDWTDATSSTGAGFLNIAQESDGSQEVRGMGVYQGFVAFFAADAVIIYSLDTDSDNFAYVETVGNTGTDAPLAITPFGNTDLFYLDATGVRSLRSRAGTNAAYKSDIGEAVDDFIQELIAEVGDEAAASARGVIEPRSGRYMLTLGQYLVVLSYFPDSKISAWSYMDFGAEIDAIARAGRALYIRSADALYVYGGVDGTVYPDADEFDVVVETPFADAQDPAARKAIKGFDQACEGDWLVELLVDPNDTTKTLTVGTVNKTIYHLPHAKVPGLTSHVAFRFTCSSAGAASLSSIALHFDKLPAA